jgi:GNAT superfamily N-acetyltransferase
MHELLYDLASPAVGEAVEENLAALFRSFGQLPGCTSHDLPDRLQILTPIAHPAFNGVYRARLAPEQLDAQVDAVLAPFQERNLPLTWCIGPNTKPPGLGEHLKAIGFGHLTELLGMAVDIAAMPETLPQPPGLRIEPIHDRKALRSYVRIVTAGFELPEWVGDAWHDLWAQVEPELLPGRHYLARLNGEPVGTTTLFTECGVAGIYNVATLPSARRQGVATALVQAALREASASGYRIGILQSSEMGAGVYHRMGFRSRDGWRFQLCVYPADAMQH